MGRRDKGVGKRRTVLQLDSPVQKKASHGDYARRRETDRSQGSKNPLQGFISQYGDSDEGDSNDEPQNGNAETQDEVNIDDPTEPPKGLDFEVANFLAEIDAISGEAADGDSASCSSPQSSAADAAAALPAGEEKPENEEVQTQPLEECTKDDIPQPPEAPTTVWQHQYDESTGHYYFWNTDTNEVTWEIPEEYSQYLLRFKEYEESLAIYEEKKTAVKNQDEENDSNETENSESASKHNSTKAKNSLVQYSFHDDEEDSEEDEDENIDSEKHYSAEKFNEPQVNYSENSEDLSLRDIGALVGPRQPSESVASRPIFPIDDVQVGPQLPTENVIVGPQLPTETDVIGPQLPREDIPIGPQMPFSSDMQAYQDDNNDAIISDSVKDNANSLTNENTIIGPKLPTHLSSESSDKQSSEEDSEEDTADSFIGPSLPPKVEVETDQTINQEVHSSIIQDDEDDLEQYALQQLEEPVFTSYEFTNTKYEDSDQNVAMVDNDIDGQPLDLLPTNTNDSYMNSAVAIHSELFAKNGSANGNEDTVGEFDPDDIDQQLEMAYETKKKKVPTATLR